LPVNNGLRPADVQAESIGSETEEGVEKDEVATTASTAASGRWIERAVSFIRE